VATVMEKGQPQQADDASAHNQHVGIRRGHLHAIPAIHDAGHRLHDHALRHCQGLWHGHSAKRWHNAVLSPAAVTLDPNGRVQLTADAVVGAA